MQLFTKELAGRLNGKAVTANCLDPGTVNTKMLYAGWGPCGIDLQVTHHTPLDNVNYGVPFNDLHS